MDEHSAPSTNPEQENVQESKSSLFQLQSTFPSTPPPEKADVGKPGEKSNFNKVLLPVILFVLVIAGIAWVTQFLPNWQESTNKNPVPKKIEIPIKFFGRLFLPEKKEFFWASSEPEMLAVWNPKEPGYYLEMEKGQSGFYDYYFENNSEQSVEIGLQKSSCDCSKVYGCVADPYQAKQYLTKLQEIFAWRNPPNPKSQKDFHWIPLEQNLVEGFEVPPGRSGMIRLTWTGRRSPGEPLRLKLTLWVQEKGNQKTRANVVLQALVRMASPIQFLSRKVRVGAVVPNNPVTKELFCWSSTRDDFDIRVTNTNPCLEIKTERISLKNPGLLAELDALKVKTQVLAARKVTVTIVDSKDGKLLDMGPLRMPLPVEFRVDEIPLDVAVPYLVGTVRSDIEIGNSRNPYQIDLGFFPSKDGIKKKFVLYTDKEVKLNHVENKPVILQVNKLEEKGIEGSKMKWILHLTVPEKRHVGSFSSGSGIVFQSIRPNGKIRRILVPITGTATQELKSKVGF